MHTVPKKTPPQNGTDSDAAAVEVYFKTYFNKQVASLIHLQNNNQAKKESIKTT